MPTEQYLEKVTPEELKQNNNRTQTNSEYDADAQYSQALLPTYALLNITVRLN